MSVASAPKTAFSTFARSTQPKSATARNFSSVPVRFARKPKFASVKAPKARINRVPSLTPEYLEKNFTPEQRAAIQAADKVVTNENIQQTGKPAHPWSLNYVDDLTERDPRMDHPVRAPWQNIDETSRLKTSDELTNDLYQLMRSLPDDNEKAAAAWRTFDENLRLTVGKEEAETQPRTALAPELPKMGKEAAKTKSSSNRREGQRQEIEPSAELLRLMQMTGLTAQQILGLRTKVVYSNRVTNQTRLGKVHKTYFLCVAGNGNGLVGIGEGKSEEGSEGMLQATYRAIRNMRPILRYENRTIYGDVDAKVSATEVELYSRPPGFGLRCQQNIFELCRAAGITDLAARVTRSRNPMNTIKAAFQALVSQKDPEDIARARGKKLVDVRKVYYANQI